VEEPAACTSTEKPDAEISSKAAVREKAVFDTRVSLNWRNPIFT
jgi:hypothetical protein